MESFVKQVENLSWNLVIIDADGNCLYRCFALEIYGDANKHVKTRQECCEYIRDNQKFFENFIPDFDERMLQKEKQYEWGDHVDINAMSELYNVRVRVFELDKENDYKLFMSFDQGEQSNTVDLPLVMLGRHRQKHYNIIDDPKNTVYKRPLGNAKKKKS